MLLKFAQPVRPHLVKRKPEKVSCVNCGTRHVAQRVPASTFKGYCKPCTYSAINETLYEEHLKKLSGEGVDYRYLANRPLDYRD